MYNITKTKGKTLVQKLNLDGSRNNKVAAIRKRFGPK